MREYFTVSATGSFYPEGKAHGFCHWQFSPRELTYATSPRFLPPAVFIQEQQEPKTDDYARTFNGTPSSKTSGQLKNKRSFQKQAVFVRTHRFPSLETRLETAYILTKIKDNKTQDWKLTSMGIPRPQGTSKPKSNAHRVKSSLRVVIEQVISQRAAFTGGKPHKPPDTRTDATAPLSRQERHTATLKE